ncbi:MAG: arylesterase [Hoeflea sp.]|uniref:arylesterase n=1 Tax=Hoeflea sp. TaxID=1940281 RepID=UPI0032EEB24E
MRFRKLAAIAVAVLGLVTVPKTAAIAADGDDPVRIVGFGDSLMAGYGLNGPEGFPARLQAALEARGYNVEITDAGSSGDTSSGGRARLDWSIPVDEEVDGVILELGANDALRGLPPEKTRENLDAIITRLKERGIEVLLAGMLAPPNLGADYESRFNAIYPELARKHNLVLYPFFLDGVTGNPSLLLDDGMHPNAKGINQMVNGILPYAEDFLARIEAG